MARAPSDFSVSDGAAHLRVGKGRTPGFARSFTIVADVGDQQADLAGPHSGKTYLLPSYSYQL